MSILISWAYSFELLFQCLVSKFTSAIEVDVEESSSKPSEDGKMPAQVNVSEVANDVNTAKIAAMKAAELGWCNYPYLSFCESFHIAHFLMTSSIDSFCL